MTDRDNLPIEEASKQPVAETRLSDFLRLLEPESRFTNGGHKFKLHKMLDEGLRFYSLSGGLGIYGGFIEHHKIGDVPVKINAYGQQCPYLPIIFEERYPKNTVGDSKAGLDYFIVRLEDAAEYYGRSDTDYCCCFPWLDESGKALSLLPNEYRKISYQPYLKAKKYLEDKWDATPDEIAQWLIGDKIKIYSSIYSGAWIVDVVNFRCCVNLCDFLNACHFDEADLEQFEPDERWFTYPELTERWRDSPLTPEFIESLIRKHYKNQDWLLIVNNPRQWHSQNYSAESASIYERKSKATLEHIKDALYQLSEIRQIEKENEILLIETMSKRNVIKGFMQQDEPKGEQPTEWSVAHEEWHRQGLEGFGKYLNEEKANSETRVKPIFDEISNMLLELSKKPFIHKSQQYSDAAQEFLDWLGDMAGEQDLDQWEKRTYSNVMAEFQRLLSPRPKPQDFVAWYRGSMGQIETVPSLPVVETTETKPEKRETEINRWLRETWIKEGKPTGAKFFDALKKYKGQKGSPILEFYSAGEHRGFKWQTSGGAIGEWKRKRIQNLASEFKKS